MIGEESINQSGRGRSGPVMHVTSWNILVSIIHLSWQVDQVQFSPNPLDLSARAKVDDSEKPVIMTFAPDRFSCAVFRHRLDHRCQRVTFHWDVIKKNIFPVFMFDFGMLRFYAHRFRMYRTDDYDLVDFNLQIRWHVEFKTNVTTHYSKEFADQNRLTLFYDNKLDALHGSDRAWFSFIMDNEYFSFNIANDRPSEPILLKQLHGSTDKPKWWDVWWSRFRILAWPPWRNQKFPYDVLNIPDNLVPYVNFSDVWTDLSVHRDPNSIHGFGRESVFTPTSTTSHPYDPERERELQFQQADGLMQYVLGRYAHHLPIRHNFLMLRGHRDWTNYAHISVTFQFTWSTLGHIVHRSGVPMIVARTINELNAIFERSGTLIRFYVHCIMSSDVADNYVGNLFPRKVLEEYAKENERIGSDLLIAFQDHVQYRTMGFPYAMHLNKSVVVVRSTSLFEVYDIAHEIGHVFGAGHTPAPAEPPYIPFVFYAQGWINDTDNKCTLMTSPLIKCAKQPLFSSPRDPYLGEVFGRKFTHDNAAWIKQNRYVMQEVGNEINSCPAPHSLAAMSYIAKMVRCLTIDLLKQDYGLLYCKDYELFNYHNELDPN